MSVSIQTTDLKQVHELFVLLREKAAFELPEFEDAGRVYKAVVAAHEKAGSDTNAELQRTDVNYILNAINVCSVRVGVGRQNYKLIAELFEVLSAAVKVDEDDEESKSE